jgi:transcriptional regulator with XRE-family HTH domain
MRLLFSLQQCYNQTTMLEFDGTKLKQLRKGQKLTQTDLAEKIFGEPKTSSISNYENGIACPPSDVLLSLMDYFKVSPEQISSPKPIVELSR